MSVINPLVEATPRPVIRIAPADEEPQFCKEDVFPREVLHVVSLSGGKDSTATACLALENHPRSRIRLTFADTGHEHPLTYKYVEYLEKAFNIPVKWVKADFTHAIALRRKYIEENWPNENIPWSTIQRALRYLQPTGNPFLDLCLYKGRFPSARHRFCTQLLKVEPLIEYQLRLAEHGAHIYSWQGIRKDESKDREHFKPFKRTCAEITNYHPLLEWSAEMVFNKIRDHGINANPLYKMNMKRVGCLPCIMVNKDELATIAMRFPEEVKRIRQWEELISNVAKRGVSTLLHRHGHPGSNNADVVFKYFNIDTTIEYAKTGHGGTTLDMFKTSEPPLCQSAYGLCE